MQIRLRPYQENDAIQLMMMANNVNVSINLNDNFPYPYTLEDAKNHILLTKQTNIPVLEFAITVNDLVCGAISLSFGQDIYSHLGEIGYWLGEPYWHQGVMQKAMSIMLNYTFTNYDIQIIIARVFTRNKSSIRLLKKNHFNHVVTFKKYGYKNGEFLDIELYQLTKQDYWLSLQKECI